MSKIRDHVPTYDEPLPDESEGDLRGWVTFTQLKADGPFFYAGWVDAADARMALAFAREHYGQDQACTAIWAAPKEAIAGDDEFAPAPDAGDTGNTETYQVFVQQTDAKLLCSTTTVDATNPVAAVAAALATVPAAEPCIRVWVVRTSDIARTREGDLIWRYTDQSYRLARGYTKQVREKWEQIREHQAYEEYEKGSLKETF